MKFSPLLFRAIYFMNQKKRQNIVKGIKNAEHPPTSRRVICDYIQGKFLHFPITDEQVPQPIACTHTVSVVIVSASEEGF